MAAIFIVAHAPLASALQAVAAHAFPERRADIAALDVNADMAEPEAAMRQALAAFEGREVLVLADAFGATPCRVALEFAAREPRVRVVAGVNVPMLWRAINYADRLPLDELVAGAISGATQGVMHVSVTPRQNQPSPPHSHGQDNHHDQ